VTIRIQRRMTPVRSMKEARSVGSRTINGA
jgi:hypothetical protein